MSKIIDYAVLFEQMFGVSNPAKNAGTVGGRI